VILMVLMGGMGTMLGPILGAFIVVALENKVGDIGMFMGRVTGIEWFNGLGEAVTIVIGLIFVICVMAFRRGIVGELGAWWAHRQVARTTTTAATAGLMPLSGVSPSFRPNTDVRFPTSSIIDRSVTTCRDATLAKPRGAERSGASALIRCARSREVAPVAQSGG
jgi:hypothetical protein